MTTNSPNRDAQALIEHIKEVLQEYEEYGGIGYGEVVYRTALAALTAVPKRMRQANGEGSRTWVECGSDYHRGTDFYTTPPAQLLRLPEKADRNHPDFYGTSDDFCAGWNHHDAEIHRLNPAAQPVSDGLYRIANHIAGAKNSLPQEWQDWAEEIESDLRKLSAAKGGQDG